jgi:hypothetical protein
VPDVRDPELRVDPGSAMPSTMVLVERLSGVHRE